MRTAQIYILDMAPGSADWAKELCGQSVGHIALWVFIHISSIQNYGNLFSWISFRHFQQFLKIMCSFVSIPPPTPSKKHRPHLAVGWNVHFHPWKRDEMEW